MIPIFQLIKDATYINELINRYPIDFMYTKKIKNIYIPSHKCRHRKKVLHEQLKWFINNNGDAFCKVGQWFDFKEDEEIDRLFDRYWIN